MTPDKVIWRLVDNEVVILHAASGNYFSLNPIGSEIWLRMNKGQQPQEIALELAKTYNRDITAIQEDVNHLIADLRAAKIWN